MRTEFNIPILAQSKEKIIFITCSYKSLMIFLTIVIYYFIREFTKCVWSVKSNAKFLSLRLLVIMGGLF